jgi:hypothetical protein
MVGRRSPHSGLCEGLGVGSRGFRWAPLAIGERPFGTGEAADIFVKPEPRPLGSGLRFDNVIPWTER